MRGAVFPKENQRHLPGHVKRRQKRAGNAEIKRNMRHRPTVRRVQDGVLAPKTGKRYDAGQGQTAEQAAFGAEVAKSTVSRILSGKLNPTVSLLDKLALHFEVDIEEFFRK